MLGDALASDVPAPADAVEQERVVYQARGQMPAAQLQPGLQLVESPGGCVLDQLTIALGQHLQAALAEIHLGQVQVDRLGLAHARAIEQRNQRCIAHALGARVGSAHGHQFMDQAALEVASAGQARAADGLDRTHLQQVVLADQAGPPRLVHHPAQGVDVQR